MLDAKELRLGNIICRRGDKKEPITVTIDLLRGVSRQGVFFEPVALTEEWLLKLGFRKQEIETALEDFFIVNYILGNFVVYILPNSFEIELISKGGEQFNLFKNFKKQVHKLQNLYFALTNEELKSPLNE